MNIRLDKYISSALELSRSDSRKVITSGRVTVNGAPVREADMKVGDDDAVIVDGKKLEYEEFIYLMMNKPLGVVCSTKDRAKTVVDLVRDAYPKRKLFPAGRLDIDSTGFVLLTDDGAFAHDILSPSKHVMKRYAVTVDGPITGEVIERFRKGMTLSDGTVLKEADLIAQEGSMSGIVEISQGIYHQIKRMFGEFSLGVTSLHRLSIGGLELDGDLEPGNFRKLTAEEVKTIKEERED